VNFSTYQKTVGSGTGHVIGDTVEGINITTEFCVAAAIKNTAGGERLGVTLTATLADGNDRTRQLYGGTRQIDPGQVVQVSACFSGAPVTNLSCDF
jgi:hypothetical protein